MTSAATIAPATPERSPIPARAAALVAVLTLAWGVWATAWFCDDAFIFLRTAENAVGGHGLRWNADERTQTFTSPLWELLLIAGRFVTGEGYFTALVLGAGATAVAITLLVFRIACGPAAAALAVAALASSRAFVEYATSGLENPLAYALVAAFATAWFSIEDRDRRLAWLAGIAGVAVLARFDVGVTLAPCLVAALPGVRPVRVVRHAAVGAVPLAVWMGFATFYYGSPWPITAFAKAFSPGVPAGALAGRAVDYAVNLALWDPVSAVLIVAGLLVAAVRRGPVLPLAIGIALHLLYLLKIGGDFMSGRFFALPAFVAAIVLARCRPAPALAWAAVLGVPLLALAGRTPPWLSSADHGQGATVPAARAISDERLFYYPRFGLRSPTREPLMPGALSAQIDELPGLQRPVIQLIGTVGFPGYVAGPEIHIVDWWLCDPLLARLPMTKGVPDWKVGHYTRRVPEGYLESLATGENRLRHPGLRPLFDDLQLVTRGPLFDAARLAAVGRLASGAHRADVTAFVVEEYDAPPRLGYAANEIAAVGTPWWEPPMQVLYAGGHSWWVGAPRPATRLRLAVDGGDTYRLEFRRDGVPLGTTEVVSPGIGWVGAVHVPVDVPEAARSGFDELRVDAGPSIEGVLAVGGFEFLD